MATRDDGSCLETRVLLNDVFRNVQAEVMLTRDDAAMFVAWCVDKDSIAVYSISAEGVEERCNFEADTYLEISIQSDTQSLKIANSDAKRVASAIPDLGAEGVRSLIVAERARRETLWQQLRDERIDQLEKMVREEPGRVFRLVCESVVNGGPPLFLKLDGRGLKGEAPHLYYELAKICLAKLDGGDKYSSLNGTLMPLSAYVLGQFQVNERGMRFDTFEPMRAARHRAADDVIRRAFSHTVFEFTVAIWRVAELAYHGVPLIDISTNSPRVVIEPDELYVYLKKKGELDDIGNDAYELPRWTEALAFDQEHLKAHDLIFSASDEISHQQVLARRVALRRMLALPDEPKSDDVIPSRSKLLRAAQLVLDRYYGLNFDLDDSSTWPKQRDVVDWLQSAHGLSEREAMAVDIVVRPDPLRRSA